MSEESEDGKSAEAEQYFLEIGGVLHPMSREYYEEIVKPWEDLMYEVARRIEKQIAIDPLRDNSWIDPSMHRSQSTLCLTSCVQLLKVAICGDKK